LIDVAVKLRDPLLLGEGALRTHLLAKPGRKVWRGFGCSLRLRCGFAFPVLAYRLNWLREAVVAHRIVRPFLLSGLRDCLGALSSASHGSSILLRFLKPAHTAIAAVLKRRPIFG